MILKSDTTDGFTRTVYEDGHKVTMVYPPGWTYGDPRQPEIHKEPCVPGPSNPRIAYIYFREPQPCYECTTIIGRRPRAARPRQIVSNGSSAVQEWPKGVRATQGTPWSHSLGTYLAQAWLPQYILGKQVDPLVLYEWPLLPELTRVSGSRKLYLVQRIPNRDLRGAVTSLKEILVGVQLTSTLAEQGKLADLTLPATTLSVLDECDARFLDSCSLNVPSDVTKLVQAYPLRTIIQAIKLFFCISDEHQLCPRLEFRDVNHLCPVQNTGLFDLIAMPGIRLDELSLLVVVAPPWDFKFDDLDRFTRAGIPGADLDLFSKASVPSDTLWAIIWDICLKHNCRYFILTTYDEWVFGTLSPDMHRARVTAHLPAPVFPRDMTVSAKDVAHRRLPVPNVLELLLLWMIAADDDTHFWWLQPPDLPEPVPRSHLSMLDGRWGCNVLYRAALPVALLVGVSACVWCLKSNV